MSTEAPQLRLAMKARRATLSETAISETSNAIAKNLWRLPEMRRARRIGVYLAAFGEVDCQPFIDRAWLRGKRTFAPILRRNSLLYAPLRNGSVVTKNRYSIFEPVCDRRQLVTTHNLDIVLVPLVAFDSNLNRLGMGGGYYDRSFAFSKTRQHWKKPRLVGVGYSFQHTAAISTEPWDVPLDRVVTEKECLPSFCLRPLRPAINAS
mgnify:CR=1 FL=1